MSSDGQRVKRIWPIQTKKCPVKGNSSDAGYNMKFEIVCCGMSQSEKEQAKWGAVKIYENGVSGLDSRVHRELLLMVGNFTLGRRQQQ